MKPTRSVSPPGTYFVTFSTWQRMRLFVIERNARLFLQTLYGYRRQQSFQLHAFACRSSRHFSNSPCRVHPNEKLFCRTVGKSPSLSKENRHGTCKQSREEWTPSLCIYCDGPGLRGWPSFRFRSPVISVAEVQRSICTESLKVLLCIRRVHYCSDAVFNPE